MSRGRVRIEAPKKYRLRKGDRVVAIAGRDKGRAGEVLEVLRDKGRVRVRGLQVMKRHTKASADSPGGMVAKEGSIHISNVALADPETGKPTRVGYRFTGEGAERKKERFAKKSGAAATAPAYEGGKKR